MNQNPQQMLSEQEKQKIASILSSKISHLECPMCHKNNFVILDGYFNLPINANYKGVVLGGPTIPAIGIVCANCGFISQHALGVLGLLNNADEK